MAKPIPPPPVGVLIERLSQEFSRISELARSVESGIEISDDPAAQRVQQRVFQDLDLLIQSGDNLSRFLSAFVHRHEIEAIQVSPDIWKQITLADMADRLAAGQDERDVREEIPSSVDWF